MMNTVTPDHAITCSFRDFQMRLEAAGRQHMHPTDNMSVAVELVASIDMTTGAMIAVDDIIDETEGLGTVDQTFTQGTDKTPAGRSFLTGPYWEPPEDRYTLQTDKRHLEYRPGSDGSEGVPTEFSEHSAIVTFDKGKILKGAVVDRSLSVSASCRHYSENVKFIGDAPSEEPSRYEIDLDEANDTASICWYFDPHQVVDSRAMPMKR